MDVRDRAIAVRLGQQLISPEQGRSTRSSTRGTPCVRARGAANTDHASSSGPSKIAARVGS